MTARVEAFEPCDKRHYCRWVPSNGNWCRRLACGSPSDPRCSLHGLRRDIRLMPMYRRRDVMCETKGFR
jgi:hypothetical protein